MGQAGRRVRGSMHFGYKATYGSWPSKEYVCRTRYRDFFCCVGANLSTQARIAIMTLAGDSLSFSDVRKACKRYADELLRDPKEHDTRGPHTVYVSQARAASVASEEQEGDSDVETALAALAGESDIDLEETDVQEILLGRTAGEPRLQTRDRARQWRETISS